MIVDSQAYLCIDNSDIICYTCEINLTVIKFNLSKIKGYLIMQEYEKYMDYKETAAYVGFSSARLVRWVRKGSFPDAIRTPNNDFLGWTKSQLVAWQQSLMKRAA